MLDLSSKFSQDVESKQTNISPLVVIDEDIYISTVKGLFDNNLFFEDYDLKLSNITDSISIRNKNIQINKLRFTLSNFPQNGQRFSDFVFERGLLNKSVEVYYKTQSCKNLDDCMLIFNGTIKKLKHDSKTIQIEIEDLTESKLKKEVPISKTGYKNPYNRNYINVPFPIVYGEVDKSPAIPIIDSSNSDNNNISISIVPDAINIVDSDRDIKVAGFNENPLYIYKDDYYQVTEEFNSSVLSEPENFDVVDSEQYIVVGGSHIEVTKKFNGVLPENAPAFNEFQCIKERSPNQFLNINNLNESQTDDAGYPFINQQLSINNPQYAIDNEYDTYSQVPDTEIDVINSNIYEGFQTFGSNTGYFMPLSGCTWGGVVFQWLNSFMHSNNFEGFDDPHIVYKHLPTAGKIKNEVEWKLRDEFDLYTENSAGMIVFKDSGHDNQPFHEQYPNEYKTKIGVTDDNDLNSYTKEGDWFVNNAPEDGSISSPQPIFFKYKVKGSLIEQLGFEEVWITMDNGTIQEPLDGTSVRIYNIFEIEDSYDYLFNSEDFAEFAPTDITTSFQDKRTHFRSYRGKLIHEDNNYNTSWTSNGFSSSGIWFGSYGFYMGGWEASRTRKSNILASSDSSWVIWAKKRIDGVGHSPPNDALWNYGYEYETPFDSNNGTYTDLKGKIHINANTMYPCAHRGHYRSGNGSGSHIVYEGVSYGILQNDNSETFTIRDNYGTTTPDSRVSLIFPFNDLDISDEISSETYFKGTIKCFFDSVNTDSASSMHFILQTAPADQIQTGDEAGTLNYATFDDEDWASKLIDKTLPLCLDNDPFWSTSSNDLIQGDNEIDTNANNFFNGISGDYSGKFKDFADTSTFSNINLTYRLETISSNGTVNEGGSTNKATLFTQIHDVGLLHYIIFEKALDSPFYLNVSGRINDNNSLIENPSEIINHFIENELMFDEVLDEDSLEGFNLIHSGDKYAFTVKEVKKGKEIIEELSKNTRLFPRFKSGSNFSFSYIKDTYSDEDVSQVINTSDIIKYSFSRTPIQHINTLVNVKYKMDYAEDDFLEETGYVDGYDMFGKGDGEEGRPDGYKYSYLGLDREDKVLEFESKYIRDKSTAERLRNFLYMFNCNQHNVFKINLPISRYISLEAGDIIEFDSLIENVRAYGEDYTQEVIRNAQTIYPFFIITKITKKLKNIDIECMQLHDLTPFKFQCATGSLTRLQSVSDTGYRSLDDFFILENYLFGGEKYFTSTQKRVADINNDGLVNEKDLDVLQESLPFAVGDLNFDGVINVADIVALVNQIISQEETSASELLFYDVNDDGFINVGDIVLIINEILSYDELDFGGSALGEFVDDVGFDEI